MARPLYRMGTRGRNLRHMPGVRWQIAADRARSATPPQPPRNLPQPTPWPEARVQPHRPLVVTRRRNARACRKRPLSASASPRESRPLSPLPRVRCGQSARRTGPLAARSAGTRGGVAGDAPSSSWDRGAYRHRVRGPILSRSTSPAPSCRGRRAGRARERASASSRSTEVDRQSRPSRRLLAANVHQPVSSRRGGAPTGGMPSGYATLGPGATHEREASPPPVAARPERESPRRQPRRVHDGGGDPAPDGPGADARGVLRGDVRGTPDPRARRPRPAPDARAPAHGRAVARRSRLGPGQGDHRAHGRGATDDRGAAPGAPAPPLRRRARDACAGCWRRRSRPPMLLGRRPRAPRPTSRPRIRPPTSRPGRLRRSDARATSAARSHPSWRTSMCPRILRPAPIRPASPLPIPPQPRTSPRSHSAE